MVRWLIIFVSALAVLFHRLFAGEVFFWGLPSLQFIPWRAFALQQLREGILPLWNPYNGAGTPLFANYQSGLMYPPNWLSFFAPSVEVLSWIMSVTAVAHLLIAGWGMWRFCERLGISPFGRGMAALAFALGGYFVARLGTFPMISAAAWLPWLLAGAHDVITRGYVRDAGLLALYTALLLTAGHAQTAWYCLLLTGFFSLWWTLRLALFRPQAAAAGRLARRPASGSSSAALSDWWSSLAIRLCGVIAALLLGAGVSALQLAATAELLGQSQRSEGAEYSFAVNFSYAPARVLNLINPHVFGTPADGSYLTEGAYFEDAVYIGFIPLLSAVAALIAWVRSRIGGGVVPFALIVSGIGFSLALGQYGSLFPFLYHHVPTFDLFQAPVRWHLWTVFGLSLLAGVGVSAWGRDWRTRRYARWGLAGGIGAMGAALAGLLVAGGAGDGVLVLIRAIMATAILGVIAALLTLIQPARDTEAHWRWSGIVLVVVAADLVWASWGLNPTIAPGIYQPDDRLAALQDAGRVYQTEALEEHIRYHEIFRFDDYRTARDAWQTLREIPLANYNSLSERYSINNFEPLLIGHYDRFMRLLANAAQNEPASSLRALERSAGITLRQSLNGTTAEQTSGAPVGLMQRAFVIGYESACWHLTEESLTTALLAMRGDSLSQVHLLGGGDCPPPSPQSAGTARVIEDRGNRVTVRVNVNRLSWLVLSDTDYPGWLAFIDGRPVPLYRANLAFRAVQVDDGVHDVVFAYGPVWLLPGVLIVLFCVILMIVLIRVRDTTNQQSSATR